MKAHIKLCLFVFISLCSHFVFALDAVDINTADAATLAERLNGIGVKKAEAIVEFREKNGKFKSVEDLALVDGIGEKTIENNREIIKLGASSNAAPETTKSPAKPSNK